jgi:hypothetical protein
MQRHPHAPVGALEAFRIGTVQERNRMVGFRT